MTKYVGKNFALKFQTMLRKRQKISQRILFSIHCTSSFCNAFVCETVCYIIVCVTCQLKISTVAKLTFCWFWL